MEESKNVDIPGLSEGRRETVRLRLFFLLPLTLVIVVIVGLSVFRFFSHQRENIQSGLVSVQASAADLYQDSINHNARALQTLIKILEKDQLLRAALARGDRMALLERSTPFYADMNRIFGVTHMYFTRPDRVNLLRVHQPDRHGDVINRFTTLEAERTGALAQGVELGPLGTFTLRVVEPWYADEKKQQLIGYVELGVEVDRGLETVRDILGVQTFVLIRKEFLKREGWESGMKTFGRAPDWERFPDFVLSTQGSQKITDELTERIRGGKIVEYAAILFKRVSYRIIPLPLRDAAGREVGQLVLQVNIAHEVESARKAVLFSSIAALLSGGLLFVFFYYLVGKIGAQLESQRGKLASLAMRDGLTKLLNHRMFYSLLEKEVTRVRRYDMPLSVLMLDIDHFKSVNDTYGHVAGDMILAGLSSLVNSQVRNSDSACRYGGEEITVILPETGMEAATALAERIRNAIEGHPFDIGEGEKIDITVSIGVSSLPAQETSVEKLVEVADKALYEAKEGGRNRVCRG